MEVSSKRISKEVEFGLLCYEKIILHIKHRYTENSLFCALSITYKLWYNFLGFVIKGLGPRSSCRGGFKKLDILTVPSLYIFALMMFVVNNPDSFQSTSSIHCISMRQTNQLHLPLVKFSSI
jgi:hypothetical protein